MVQKGIVFVRDCIVLNDRVNNYFKMGKKILNNKKCIICIEAFLVLYMIVAGFFIFKIINDRIKYLSRNNTLNEVYIDIPSDSIKESYIFRNKKSKREILLNKLVNKTGSTVRMSDFYKDVNESLLDGRMFIKMYKEFSVIDIFRTIKQLPELTGYYIQTIDL